MLIAFDLAAFIIVVVSSGVRAGSPENVHEDEIDRMCEAYRIQELPAVHASIFAVARVSSEDWIRMLLESTLSSSCVTTCGTIFPRTERWKLLAQAKNMGHVPSCDPEPSRLDIRYGRVGRWSRVSAG
jgi:hypothetical protein